MNQRASVYVHLLQGYDHPGSDPEVATKDGPTFAINGKIIFAPQTIEFIEWRSGQLRAMQIVEGSIYYDNVYFRLCSIATARETSPTLFDPELADWNRRQNWSEEYRRGREHQSKYAQLSDKERFQKVASLLESSIEDRLGLLRTLDESERDYLLTSDIDDQIAHWEWIRQELIELKSAE